MLCGSPGDAAGAVLHRGWLIDLSLPEPAFDYPGCLAACARGERHALAQLYQQEGARLLGVALRIVRDAALAEDVVHDAFMKIWAGAATYDPARGSARGWVFSVTRHLALNRLRDSDREVLGDEYIDQALDSQLPDDPYAGGARLQHCLGQLEPARRSCIVHAYVDGYSHAQIALKLNTPLGTVKAWIKRSLTALRECMG